MFPRTDQTRSTKMFLYLISIVMAGAALGTALFAQPRANQVWGVTTGDKVASSPALSENEIVYAGSDDGNIYCIEGGNVEWTFPTQGQVTTAPAVDNTGIIYAGSSEGYLYALNPDGTEKWSLWLEEPINTSPAIGIMKTVFVAAGNKLYAFESNGTQKWIFNAGSTISSSPATVRKGEVYITTQEGRIHSIQSDGSQKWEYSAGSAIESSPAVSTGHNLFVGSDDGVLHHLSSEGVLIWSYPTGTPITSSPAIGKDCVYVGSQGGTLYAFELNAPQLAWSYDAGAQIESSPAIGQWGQEERVYVGSMDGKLHSVYWNGSAFESGWTFETGDAIRSSPAIGKSGKIYFGSDDMNIYAIEDDYSISGPAKTAWPMFHQGYRRCGRDLSKYCTLNVNRTTLNFGAIKNGTSTPGQTILIENSDIDNMNWTTTISESWLSCTPTSGIDSGTITVSVDASGLDTGSYTGTLTITAPDAGASSPATISINLEVIEATQDQSPFGSFETPINNATVMSSIPITGWALDDIHVDQVKIYYTQGGGDLVHLGDAVFVDGARPDVEGIYPNHPRSYAAGWGYMLLTQMLPNQGNGSFTLHVIATDSTGNTTTLGKRTITADNASNVKPFGAIDTPAQGGVASGSQYMVQGWVLTPQPNTMPTDGSSIEVYIDGVKQGNLHGYNMYRPDVANLFPGYNNSDGAGGYFMLDTTQFENGMHTIQWTATDDGNQSDGLGSRYFYIQNSGRKAGRAGKDAPPPDTSSAPGEPELGPSLEKPWLYPLNGIDMGSKALMKIDCTALLGKSGGTFSAYASMNGRLGPLPVGATLDTKKGRFYWQPGPAMTGSFGLHYFHVDSHFNVTDIQLDIHRNYAGKSIDSYLGDNPEPCWPDLDVFSFSTDDSEKVEIMLADAAGGPGAGGEATLLLFDALHGGSLFVHQTGDLPLEFEVDLPGDGKFFIAVCEHPGCSGFEGNYTLTMDAQAEICQTIEPTCFVEE